MEDIIYTVDYFIKKFEAIPEEKWGTGVYFNPSTGKHCAYGHCGAVKVNSEEVIAIDKITFPLNFNILCINDGEDKNYQQPTPKQRVLAALRDIKKLNSETEVQDRADITKELAVMPVLEKLDVLRFEKSSLHS